MDLVNHLLIFFKASIYLINMRQKLNGNVYYHHIYLNLYDFLLSK